MIRIKNLSTAWTLAGWIVILAVTSTGSLYVLNAVAGHNDAEKVHLVAASIHDKDADAHLLMQRKLLEQMVEDVSEEIALKVVSKLKEHDSL